jgi:hypothetical protein
VGPARLAIQPCFEANVENLLKWRAPGRLQSAEECERRQGFRGALRGGRRAAGRQFSRSWAKERIRAVPIRFGFIREALQGEHCRKEGPALEASKSPARRAPIRRLAQRGG